MITEPLILYITKISLCTGSLKQSNAVIKEPPFLKQCFLNGRNHYLTVCLFYLNPKPLTLFSLEIKIHISQIPCCSSMEGLADFEGAGSDFPMTKPLHALEDICWLSDSPISLWDDWTSVERREDHSTHPVLRYCRERGCKEGWFRPWAKLFMVLLRAKRMIQLRAHPDWFLRLLLAQLVQLSQKQQAPDSLFALDVLLFLDQAWCKVEEGNC